MIMNKKLALLTVCFALIAVENTLRVLDFIKGWSFQSDPERPTDTTSDQDMYYSDFRHVDFEQRESLGISALFQT